jgi:predicted extracellular nuclease
MPKRLFFIALLISSMTFSQKERSVAFYNVENLFDTIDGVNDDAEFLPSAKSQWNATRYNEKILHINKVLGELKNPLIVGFCEIENATVVRDVIKDSAFPDKYGLVHYESPDARGIDVAMIYDSSYLKVAASGKLRFILPGQESPSTRDILWAKYAHNKDTIFAMVNHWPSRRSGQDESEPNRLKASETARHFIDSLLNVNCYYKIVFMGDLNDYPSDKAPKLIAEKLNPMILASNGKFGGSHNYNNEWDVLDHIMVSQGLMKKKGIKAIKNSGEIHSFDYLLTEYKGQIVPFRTYGGSKYLGGYSDHLPVSIKVSAP